VQPISAHDAMAAMPAVAHRSGEIIPLQ